MTSSYWFQGSTEGPDLGDSIGQSLRFRGAQYLERTFAAGGSTQTCTMSMWVKIATPDQYYNLFSASATPTDQTVEQFLFVNGIASMRDKHNNTFRWQRDTTGLWRDPGAWYHLVFVRDTTNAAQSDRIIIYVNGERQTLTGTQPAADALGVIGSANIHRLGQRAPGAAAGPFEGHMADVYFIDGQTLEPEAFGRYNRDGVWVPVKPEGLTFGANGFHLDFSDPNDLGADRSGNGNDFTPTGFVTAKAANYEFTSSSSTPNSFPSTSGGFNAPFELPSSYVYLGSTTGTFTWNFNSPIVANNSIGIYWQGTSAYGNNSLTITYADTTTTTHAFDDPGIDTQIPNLVSVNTTGGEIVKLELSNTGGSLGGFAGLEIDGSKLLLEGDGSDYDWMQDSPTQNHSTLNPGERIPNNGSAVLSEANLEWTGNQGGTAANGFAGSIGVPSGKWYWETTISDTGSGLSPEIMAGIVSGTIDSSGSDGVSYRLYFNRTSSLRRKYDLGSFTDYASFYGTFTTGDVWMIAFDATNGNLWYGKNGSWFDNASGSKDPATDSNPDSSGIDTTKQWRPFGAAWTSSGSGRCNFGQQPFLYTPPEGFKALQTQNLDKPTIVDGGEHFRTLTGPGSSILSISQGDANGDNGTGFQRGLWWIKDRANANNHQIVFDNSGDAFGCPTTGLTAYTPPLGDSVAWCWNVDDPGKCGVDTMTGVSLYEANQLFTHNLGQPADFIIALSGEASNYHPVYHKDATGWLVLNSDQAQVDPKESMFPTNTSTQIGAGTVAFASAGQPVGIIAMRSVPGYSAFDSYQGNGDADGPFVYTGFRPAFVMVKLTSGAGGSWMMLDTARSLHNPAEQLLFANADTAETVSASYYLDILSNGFKLKTGDMNINGNSETYIYAAFARHPFGGKGIAPATAAMTGPDYYDGILPGISQSLRFRGAQELNRPQPATASNRRTFTLSVWVKKATNGPSQQIFNAESPAGSSAIFDFYYVKDNETIQIYEWTGSAYNINCITNAVFRDPGAWYHLVLRVDTTQATPDNRVRLYVNGEQQTFSTNTQPSQNYETNVNSASGRFMRLGQANSSVAGGQPLDGYMTDVYLIDGQALEPTAFGEYNDDNIWVPIDPTITDYGPNGFKLVMDPAYESGDILRDQSGNGNDFTMSGFETGDYYSDDFDWMKDGPTENYATLNPLFNNGTLGPGTLSDANLNHSGITQYFTAPGTLSLKNGAYYFELTNGPTPATTTFPAVGIIRNTNTAINSYVGYDTSGNVYGYGYDGYNGTFTGSTNGEGTTTATQIGSGGSSWQPGDVIGIRCDVPNNYIAWYHNNVLVYEITNLNSDYDWMPATSMYANPSAPNSINFGQRPFKYDIPAGYEALQTANLPEAPIANGRDHFNVIEYTGNATARSITGLDFQPDLVWLKSRSEEGSNSLFDSVRGATNVLFSNRTDSQETNSTSLTSFDSNGFSLGTGTSSVLTNANAITYVAWCWKAGGAAVTNNDGSIDSQVSANTDAGFSIVTYSGQSSNFTWGHGLNQPPEMVIIKPRNANAGWSVYHKSLGATKRLQLNQKISSETVNYFQNTEPTDSVFSVSTNLGTGADGTDYVAYCWHSVPGYSKIGSFSGNGNANGPFVYTGFRPAFILIKNASASVEWRLTDSTRDRVNPVNHLLQPDLTNAEQNTANVIDFLSNGFKIRGDFNGLNGANETMAYIAFAENPFGSNNAR